ncbi:hypothetical protein BKA70DRAFT_1424647 [Coprinopsis sp. MPI-PUGE-AT-0042]|nr:hypothetical protein BKA70DRAFT_1424647 [Coprinopsis sp. MPI-PUGE-AT-0042]
MPHSPTKASSRRRSGRQHRPPTKFRNSPSNPFCGLSPREEKLKKCRRSTLKPAGSLFGSSTNDSPLPDSDGTTPIKVKLEETTPVGSLFSSPLMMRTGNQTHLQASILKEKAAGVEPIPVAPASQRQDAEFSTPEGFSPAQYSTNRSSPAGDESSEILNGIGQNPYQCEQPVSSPVRPVMASSSDFDEIRALDLPKSFFRENRIKGFDPRLSPKSNIGALCDFGS